MSLNSSDRLIVHALLANTGREVSQQEFANRAGVSARTVTNRLPELRKARIVARDRWALGPGLGLALVAAADDDRVSAAIIDSNGTVHCRVSERLPGGIRTARPAATLSVAAGLLHESWRSALAGRIGGHPVKPADLRGICLGLPTAIGRDQSRPQVRGYALQDNGWRSSPVEELLKPHLASTLQDLPVDALNDANCDALAVALDRCKRPYDASASHSEILLAVRLSTGVGAGIVKLAGHDPGLFRLNASTLIVGSEGLAGELGHLQTRSEIRTAVNRRRGPLALMEDLDCSCGARHHLEGRVGVNAFLNRIQRTDAALVPPDMSPSAAVASLVARPSDLVARALRDVGHSVGVALNGAVLLLDPSYVVFTGPLGVQEVCHAAEAHCVQSQANPNRVRIECAPVDIREDVTLIGAGIAVLRRQVLKGLSAPEVEGSGRQRPRIRRRQVRSAAHRPHGR